MSLTLESGRDFDIAVEQVIRYYGVELEADSLRSFGNIDQDAIRTVRGSGYILRQPGD